jgi:hypothetical protein
MPYALKGDCVFEGNKKLKCYEGKDAHEQALAYFRALKINVKTSNTSPISELSMYVSKVSVDKSSGGTMRWRATASDVAPDLYQERMSNELYDDFIQRINSNVPVPHPFDKAIGEDWKGGMPYVSISHYKSGTGAKNVPGMPEKIYRDGDKLKAVGTLHDNPIGRAVFKSLCEDLYSEKAKTEGKIRISIGFLDLEHKHLGKGNTPDYTFTRKGLEDKCPMCQAGTGEKVYIKGQLVHLALTRVPVNPRTDMEVAKAMTIETKKQDAESIIGKELSDTLEEKSLLPSYLVTKSEEAKTEKANMKLGLPGQEPGTGTPVGGGTPDVQPALQGDAKVTYGANDYDEEELEGDVNKLKDEEEELLMPDMRPVAKKSKEAADKAADVKGEEPSYDEADEQKREERRNRPAGEKSLLQKSFDAIESKLMEMKSLNVPAETALRDIQPLYNAFGEQIKKSVQPELTPSQVGNEVTELTNIVKSLAETVSTLQQTMSTEIATLKAQTLTAARPMLAQGVPMPRSLSGNNLPQPTVKRSQIEEIAYKSTLSR